MLDPTKKTSDAIPTKIVKLAKKQICKDLANHVNECIKQNKFPNELKIADITPILKKEDALDKTELYAYKQATNCFNFYQFLYQYFKRLLFNQLQHFSNKVLSSLLWEFRKDYITQYALISLLEK